MLFSKKNYQLFLLGIGLMVVGYVLLGQGPETNPLSLNVAPVMLVLAYCVVVPLALIVKSPESKDATRKKSGV